MRCDEFEEFCYPNPSLGFQPLEMLLCAFVNRFFQILLNACLIRLISVFWLIVYSIQLVNWLYVWCFEMKIMFWAKKIIHLGPKMNKPNKRLKTESHLQIELKKKKTESSGSEDESVGSDSQNFKTYLDRFSSTVCPKLDRTKSISPLILSSALGGNPLSEA